MGLHSLFHRTFSRQPVSQRADSNSTPVTLTTIVPSIRTSPPRRGTREFLTAYNESPWLRAVVSKIASSIAQVEWRVSYNTAVGNTYKPQHSLSKMLRSGNPFMTGIEIWRLTQTHLDLVGEAFWVLERLPSGAPYSIMPVPPHWVLDVARPDRPSYILQVPNGFHGAVAAKDVIWFRDPDPLRPYERGSGIAMSLDEDLDADRAARHHISSFLANQARPDLVITGTAAAPFSREDATRLEVSWTNRHSGPERSGRPIFLPGEVNIQEIGHAPKDLEMTAIRQFERDTVVSVFGIPPEKLGILNNSNRASIEAADLFFVKDVLLPRLNLLRAVIMQRLIPQFNEPDLEINFVSPEMVDHSFILQVASAAPWSRSIDEWRAMQGLPPLPNGAGSAFPPMPAGDNRKKP